MKLKEFEIIEKSFSFSTELEGKIARCPKCDRQFPRARARNYYYCPHCGVPLDLVIQSWPPQIEKWVSKKCVGSVLNVCCGYSEIGFRVDLVKRVKPDLIADVYHLPFAENTFDTVLCDPPFSYYQRGKKWFWLAMKDIARKRLILSTSLRVIPMGNKGKIITNKIFFALQCSTNFLRLFQIFDLKESQKKLVGEEED